MKKSLLFFYLSITVLVYFPAFALAQSDPEKQNLHGNVQSVKEVIFLVQEEADKSITKTGKSASVSYEFNQSGNLIYWADFYQDGMISWYYTIEYDSVKNQKIQTYRMNENFQLACTVFQYDDAGNESYWYHKDPGDMPVFMWRNFYTKKGYRIRSESFNGSDTLKPQSAYVYKNDKKGKRISEHSYSLNGTCTKIVRTHYSKKDHTVVVAEYTGDEKIKNKLILVYNEKNQLLEKWFYEPSAILSWHIAYSYDDFGNQTAIKNYDSADSLISVKTYQYTYDEQNNWIRRLERNNDVLEKSAERELIYFE